jgi:hypothetical protein
VVPAASLARGTWLIAAVVRRGDATVGQVSRAITINTDREQKAPEQGSNTT